MKNNKRIKRMIAFGMVLLLLVSILPEDFLITCVAMDSVDIQSPYELNNISDEIIDDYEQNNNLDINPEDIQISVLNSNYTGEEQQLITQIIGVQDGDGVYYSLNCQEWTDSIPTQKNVGEYEVYVKITREGYNDFVSEKLLAYITKADMDESGFKIILNEGLVYNGEEQQLIKEINGLSEEDEVWFSMDDGSTWARWTETEKPIGVNAGDYEIKVKIVNESYNDVVLDGIVATINRANPQLHFSENYTDETFDILPNKQYSFKAICDCIEDANISYSVKNITQDDNTSIAEIASISEEGTLTLIKGGYIICVEAKFAGNENYEEKTVVFEVVIVNNQEDLIYFLEKEKVFIIGTSELISNQQAMKLYECDNGQIEYFGEVCNSNDTLQDIGLEISRENGTVNVNNLSKLNEKLIENGGNITIKVIAHKEKGKRTNVISNELQCVYSDCISSYQIDIIYEPLSENGYVIKNNDGVVLEEANGLNGWCVTDLLVEPIEGYSVAKNVIDGVYEDIAKFGNDDLDQGTNSKIIYLKNTVTGGIAAPVNIWADKIDSKKPHGLAVEFPNTETLDGIKYYSSKLDIKLIAYDAASGIDTFYWKYIDVDGSAENDEQQYEGVIKATQDANDMNKYTAVITIPQDETMQLCGKMVLSATDKAGNVSELVNIDDMFVVDTIAPVSKVSYGLKDKNGKSQKLGNKTYFPGTVTLNISIKEANFSAEDVDIVLKKNNQDVKSFDVDWEMTDVKDEYITSFDIIEDGEYTICLSGNDRAGNEMETYVSEIIVIDTIEPTIYFSYLETDSISKKQSLTITVNDKNFNKSDIEISPTICDVNGNYIDASVIKNRLNSCKWESEGNIHTIKLYDDLIDGIYELEINCRDKALNNAKTLRTEKFVVDNTAPSVDKMYISFSESLIDIVLNKITIGFYNPNVIITFTAYDNIAGIDYFVCNYYDEKSTEVNNKSIVNKRIKAIQDENNKGVYTATIKLPIENGLQLKGYISFLAVDKCGNKSEILAYDKNVAIVDTVAPRVKVDYSSPNNHSKNSSYYSEDIVLNMTIYEDNFYAEDVEVLLKKNDKEIIPVAPKWEKQSDSIYRGTYTIKANTNHKNDGEYVFSISYTDKSGNRMQTYISDRLVLDTMEPEINVDYLNKEYSYTLLDEQGNTRYYYNEIQTAKVIINEKNFNPKDVAIKITAKDIAGRDLTNKTLYSISNWTKEKDYYYAIIKYSGDANYSFDIECYDMAKNLANDYKMDFFTVDKTPASDISITYSACVSESIIESNRYRFYDEPVEIIITATDRISGINAFEYSFFQITTDDSVSHVFENSIKESEIEYTDNGATAMIKVLLPKGDLNLDNQLKGYISVSVRDRNNNVSEKIVSEKIIVVDNEKPMLNVEYNDPVNILEDIMYFSDEISMSLYIKEDNFYEQDVKITIDKDGEIYETTAHWIETSKGVYKGSLELYEDGKYLIKVELNDKSGNHMDTYISRQMVIDTHIDEPTVLLNGKDGNGQAYTEEVDLIIIFNDTNFESYDVTLTRIEYNGQSMNANRLINKKEESISSNEGKITYQTFDIVQENDGKYILNVKIKDRAGNVSNKKVEFVVNRFGSVYLYDSYLSSMIRNGGSYVQTVTSDIEIREFNAVPIINNSQKVEITLDGRPLENPMYEVELVNDGLNGNEGWYEYKYTISRDNFKKDGLYKVSVSSKDVSGNKPENSNYHDKYIAFRVDKTSPEINSVVGLEERIVNASYIDVSYSVFDAIGLESVVVYVDGEIIVDINEFDGDINNYTGIFRLYENEKSQNVRIVVTDIAGNVIDTDNDNFKSVYKYNDDVTISTSFLVRWYANKIIFWGSICGVMVLLTTVVFVVIKKKKNNMQEKG